MIALLRAETRKLGGSLALLLALVAPALPGILAMLAVLSNPRAPRWETVFSGFILPIWALFLLPMVVAAFTVLVAQIEYRTQGWSHLLALPIARWRVFAAKTLIVLAAVVAMTVLVVAFTWIGTSLGGAISGHAPVGAFPWTRLAQTVPSLLAAAAMLVVLQLWAALRFASFVVPLGIGIVGTLVAMAAAMTRTDQADWFPWVLPLKILSAPDPMPFALIGGLGGLIALGLMVADLSRHDFR